MSIFDTIYKYNLWGNGSGTGSIPWNNTRYVSFLQKILDEKKIKNVVEIGCGDYRLWKDIQYNGKYVGLDIVSTLIIDNNIKYGTDRILFINWDISKEKIKIDDVELIIIKDMFMHLPNSVITHIITNIEYINPKYILITEDTHYMNLNYDIIQGMYRPLYIDKYIDKDYRIESEIYYYELTYIIYLTLIGILVIVNKLFIIGILLWIPKKRISLFKHNSA